MADRRKKLIFVITGLTFGGVENLLCQVATRLKNNGWDIAMVSMTAPLVFTEELAGAGIPLMSLGMKKGVPDPRAIFRLADICREWQPAILHSHMVHANLLARVARPLCGVPLLVCTAHNINEGRRWLEVAYRLTDRLADLTTQVSHAGVERYVQVGATPRAKLVCVPNGVNVDRFCPDRVAGMVLRQKLRLGNHFVWLAVGRLEVAKDYPNMLAAFARVQKEHRDAVLLIVGQGSLEEKIAELSIKLGIAGRVRMLGVRRDIPALMNAADGYLMSSAWEGMPNVLLEAAACALPIVFTDVGGNSEIVIEGGVAVRPGDSTALAQAMLKLMELSSGERRLMGEAGRTYVAANYSLETIVAAWETLYSGLLAGSDLGGGWGH